MYGGQWGMNTVDKYDGFALLCFVYFDDSAKIVGRDLVFPRDHHVTNS